MLEAEPPAGGLRGTAGHLLGCHLSKRGGWKERGRWKRSRAVEGGGERKRRDKGEDNKVEMSVRVCV